MIERGRLNSRLKDYFDIWLLAQHFDFDGPTLLTAIAHTMERRRTAIPDDPEGLQPIYARGPGRAQQWRRFVERNQVKGAIPDLDQVVSDVRAFLLPVSQAARGTHHSLIIGRPEDRGGRWLRSLPKLPRV